MIASEGPPVAIETANAAPILDVAAPDLGPRLNHEQVPGLPSELQPDPGDILLSKAFWPWVDLGAQGIPENWLYMTRKVQGTIAMLAVQTDAGPKLVKADNQGQFAATLANDINTPIPIKGSNAPTWFTKKPDTLTRFHGPGAGVQASITFIAGGWAYEVVEVGFSVVSGGTGGALRAQILDGAVVLWEHLLSVTATANDKDHIHLSDLDIIATFGHAITIQITPALTGAFEEVTATIRDIASFQVF